MNTRLVPISAGQPEPSIIAEAAKVLTGGGLVAFPTETVYGLGADAMNPVAIERIFFAKGRPADNPLIVHAANLDVVKSLVSEIPGVALTLAERFWPGPMTLVLNAKSLVPGIVRGNLPTVAVRIPNHPVALALLVKFGGGIVAPSANTSGRSSPTLASHVLEDLNGKIDLILDAGQTLLGVESTVIDVTVQPPLILRQGGLTSEKIQTIVRTLLPEASNDFLKRSPGTRYRHYAPRAKVVLIERGDVSQLQSEIARLNPASLFGGIFESDRLVAGFAGSRRAVRVVNAEVMARDLFRLFREFDADGIRMIFVEKISEEGIGAALMERLRKASSPDTDL